MTQTLKGSMADVARERQLLVRSPSQSVASVVKRGTDIVLSALLLLVFLPLLAVLSVAVKLESRGPVFYRAERVGRGGVPLKVLKYRKMREGARGNPLTAHLDTRFTRIGHLLAKWKLDEIPQLWNVLRGQMSLVGPRPEDLEFVSLHMAEYGEILTVRPGITGLGQLAFTNETQILDPDDAVGHYVKAILPQKVQLDRLYARNWTIRGDLQILVWTILPVVLRVDVAVNRMTGSLTIRRRRAGSTSSD